MHDRLTLPQTYLLIAGFLLIGACTLLQWWRLRRAVTKLTLQLRRETHDHELAQRALESARQQISRLQSSQLALRDAERRRIARDLHDDLGQQLLALSFDIADLVRQHRPLAASLAPFESRLRSASRALRAIVRNLQPEPLEAGLHGALQQQVEQFSRLSGIPCRLEAEPAALGLPPNSQLDAVLYRILQESLSNIVRHARASEVSIALRRIGDGLSMTIRDNGVGLHYPPARRGSGLRSIAQRVAEAGGQFEIASEPGRGTALTLSLPLQ